MTPTDITSPRPAGVTLDDLPLRADLRGAVAYGAPSVDVPVRLNTNENSHPLPAALVADLADALGRVAAGLNRYPDRDAVALRADLADYLRGRPGGAGVGPERVWAANGSNEILTQLLQAFGGPGRRALGFTPTYSMYPHLCATTGTGWVDARVGTDVLTPDLVATRIRETRPDLVFLCSPNNPTGAALPPGVVEAASAHAPGMVVVDEAYAEFARPGATAALGLLDGRPNLVVTRTMSKAFGMAGLRVGYLAADPAVVRALLLVRLPYHLSALTQAAARVALAHAPALLDTVAAIVAQRDRISRALPGMGLIGADSDANFVLIGRFTDSGAAWRALLDHGVAVRDVGIPGWLRVTAGTPTEVDAFLAALAVVAPGHRVADGVPAGGRAVSTVAADQ